MPDKYKNFRDLTAVEREGRDYDRVVKERHPRITIIAPHGGGIEGGTSELARAITDNEFSLYCFEGLKETGNKALHITSTNFNDSDCVRMVAHSAVVLAVHGCKGEQLAVFVGGLNKNLRDHIIGALNKSGFHAEEDVSHHAGLEPRNICNRKVPGGGVQLEITEGLRRAMFKGLKRQERSMTTPMFDRFVAVIRDAVAGFSG